MSSAKSRRPRLTLRIDALAFGGEAVGRDAAGRAVFVAGAAPGDVVEVEVVSEKARFARAELVRVVEAGEARREAPCVLANRCGGCPWMHVDEEAQRAAKQAIVARALGRSGAPVEVRPIAFDPDRTLGWRTRARMRLAAVDGAIAIGFSGRRSHALVPVERCLALDPRLDAALREAARAVERAGLRGGAEVAGVVAAGADDRVHLAFESDDAAALGPLEAAAQGLVGVARIVGVVVRAGRRETVAGERELELAFGERTSAAGFQQANATMNERMRATVAELAAPAGQRLLELYAGDGNLTRALAAAGPARLLAVEGEPGAASRLVRNVARLPSVDARADDAAGAARRLADGGERFDVVVLDPPRAGAADAVPSVARLGAERIVYVSCDPMTLARDVETLGQLGYVARLAQPFELMPQTSHVEVVCLLVRR
jgi:23S rRNA (uracil1939-C5)-methyltransferase